MAETMNSVFAGWLWCAWCGGKMKPDRQKVARYGLPKCCFGRPMTYLGADGRAVPAPAAAEKDASHG